MGVSVRQPFADLAAPRLHSLHSARNRQNVACTTPAISTTCSLLKPSTPPTTGKRCAAALFDLEDAENLDASVLTSPSKKSKTGNGTILLSPLCTQSPARPRPAFAHPSAAASIHKALSVPNSTVSTPVSLSRGSPKHKRVGLLSKRRQSSSPFRRVDPPSLSRTTCALPFSIDAALSGTIPNYASKSKNVSPTPTSDPAAALLADSKESMPKAWFFEIHEDTPEQEAANLMEHSASVLDISSEDGSETRRLAQDRECGKENVPPHDGVSSQHLLQQSAGPVDTLSPSSQPAKLPRLRTLLQDAMDEDRTPLGVLPAEEFYGDGCHKDSFIIVDAGIERPSGLSHEVQVEANKSNQDVDSSDVIAQSLQDEHAASVSGTHVTSHTPPQPSQTAPFTDNESQQTDA